MKLYNREKETFHFFKRGNTNGTLRDQGEVFVFKRYVKGLIKPSPYEPKHILLNKLAQIVLNRMNLRHYPYHRSVYICSKILAVAPRLFSTYFLQEPI